MARKAKVLSQKREPNSGLEHITDVRFVVDRGLI